MRPNNITTLPLHSTLNIPINGSNNQIQGNNDLFAIVIIFKTLLSIHSFGKFYRALDIQMSELAQKLHTISITAVEHAMGFIANWKELNPFFS